MGQAQQELRAVLIVEDDAEVRQVTVALLKMDKWTPSSVKARKLHLQSC